MCLRRRATLRSDKQGLALLFAVHEAVRKANGHQGHGTRDRKANFERLVFRVVVGHLLIVFVIGGTFKVTSLATKVVIEASRVPSIAKTLFDGHFVQLPRVEVGVLRLGLVELAELCLFERGRANVLDRVITNKPNPLAITSIVILTNPAFGSHSYKHASITKKRSQA